MSENRRIGDLNPWKCSRERLIEAVRAAERDLAETEDQLGRACEFGVLLDGAHLVGLELERVSAERNRLRALVDRITDMVCERGGVFARRIWEVILDYDMKGKWEASDDE